MLNFSVKNLKLQKMKKNNRYSLLTVLLLTFFMGSCVDFLDEENKTGSTQDVVYSTKSGIDGLVASCYSYSRGWYGKEAAFGLSEGGTDLWLTGYDNRQKILINYSGITPEPAGSTQKETMNACFDEYWEMLYQAVNTCNTAIKFVSEASTNILSANDKEAYLGEAKSLRAFYYWHLVETWGPVQINRDPINSSSTIAHRDSEADVYTFMLNDVEEAIGHLATKTVKTGRINLWAAKALKARLLIYKASKFNDANAYQQAAAVADDLISGSGASFYTNYSDCWSAPNANGSANKEVIWYVDYSSTLEYNILPKRLKLDTENKQLNWAGMIARNTANTTGGNASHLMFVGVWNLVPGLTTLLIRTDTEAKKSLKVGTVTYNLGTDYQAYSKGFTRFVPSGYLLDLFNDTTDQRYKSSFRDVYYLAKSLQGAVTLTAFPNIKDTAIYLSKRDVTPAQIARASKRYVLFSRTDVGNASVYPLYDSPTATNPTLATGTAGNNNVKGDRMFIQLKKFDDLTGSIIQDLGDRDAFIFRLSEMYLIAAEGYMMSGNSGMATTRLNDLRTARAIAGKANTLNANELAQVNNKDINVILDERGRELCGEQQRWFDLKRTGKLLERVQKYNGAAAANIKDFHVFRPIPQAQLDAITNKGDFYQNNGY
jgi:hypothetical protein